MTVPTTNSTETLLQELMKTVSTLTKEVSELKKAFAIANPRAKQSLAMVRTTSTSPLTMRRGIAIPLQMRKTINLSAPLNALSFQKRAKPFWRPFSARRWNMLLERQRLASTGNQTPGGLGAQSSAQ